MKTSSVQSDNDVKPNRVQMDSAYAKINVPSLEGTLVEEI